MAADDTSDQNRSGSRWEPQPGSTPAGSEEPTTVLPSGDAESEPAAPAAGTSPRRRRLGLGVPAAAAVAAGLVVAGGLGGFALGAATSGDELSRVSDGGVFHRFHDDRDGGPPGFPGAPPELDGEDLPPGLDGDDDDEDGEDGDDEDPGSNDGTGAEEDTGSAT